MPSNGPLSSGDGRIITFYSFKGGVGRTMALANVAFLAAMNNKRVLVMDWDLEAPGLHYYFRGMQDVAATKEVRAAPGVLDLVWDWSTRLRTAEASADLERLAEEYRSGIPFRTAVRSLLPDFDEDTVLDHIGAGAPIIATPHPTPYEDALARFDWSTFFTEEAGGTMLGAFRNWAKAQYDFILLDSRTGFADVAGICTMQIPDQVALCYIYNRQNIDGIAQVAGAIRARRGSEIELRSVPMRVARENTSEEADARARARKELTRKGGFAADAVDFDQKQLSIQQAPNVPFYETIALISSDRPRSDQLALDYLNLASQLLGFQVEMPQPYEGWVQRVRSRLQPRQAAPDYLIELRSKEPDRAIEEVTQLLDSALEEQVDGGADSDYVAALIATVTHLARSADDPWEVNTMLSLSLDLLRDLAANDEPRWRTQLGGFLEFYLDIAAILLDPEEELLLLEEVDAILSTIPGDEAKWKRLAYWRRTARIYINQNNPAAAGQQITELARLRSELGDPPIGEDGSELIVTDMDIALMRGDIQLSAEKPDKAKRHFETGLRAASADQIAGRVELMRLRFELHVRLAHLPLGVVTAEEAATHANEAVKWSGNSNMIVLHFVDLGEVILRTENGALLADFVIQVLRSGDRRQQQFQYYFARSPRHANGITDFVKNSRDILGTSKDERDALIILFDLLTACLEFMSERRSHNLRANADFFHHPLAWMLEVINRDSELSRLFRDRLEGSYIRMEQNRRLISRPRARPRPPTHE